MRVRCSTTFLCLADWRTRSQAWHWQRIQDHPGRVVRHLASPMDAASTCACNTLLPVELLLVLWCHLQRPIIAFSDAVEMSITQNSSREVLLVGYRLQPGIHRKPGCSTRQAASSSTSKRFAAIGATTAVASSCESRTMVLQWILQPDH